MDAAFDNKNRKRPHNLCDKPVPEQQKNSRPRQAFPVQGSSSRMTKPPRAHGPQTVAVSHSVNVVDHGCPSQNVMEENAFEGKKEEIDDGVASAKDLIMKASKISEVLPENICKQYALMGKEDNLFNWQRDCLAVPGVLDGKSIVFCAPTSAGKSLVAEILLLKKIIETDKAGMLVLPFVALCAEKAQQLEILLKPLQKKVRRFYGTQGSQSVFSHDTGILVCTIEKANTLTNRMIEENILDRLGIVVVDELHMVNDPHRGYLLELMLSKLRFMNRRAQASSTEPMQIVGMSATLPNGNQIAEWLGAELFVTDTRPVPLKQFLVIGKSVLDPFGTEMRTLQPPQDWTNESDRVGWLTKETVDNGHSVLIFCCSRKACEICAKEISDAVDVPLMMLSIVERRNQLLVELTQIVGDHRQTLSRLIQRGVAFHHAGLSSEERRLVERAYKSGAVSVLTATSTLAAGVNLPARRVIFREPYVGIPNRILDATTYRQMAGRAGRAGIDDEGESFLLDCKPVQTDKLRRLIQSDIHPVHSCLGGSHDGILRLLLEAVSNDVVHTHEDVDDLVQSTLLAHVPSTANEASSAASQALEWLCDNHLITWQSSNEVANSGWYGCPLGQAIISAGMDPRECAVIRDDLEKAMQHLVLSSDLQLAFLVTPYNNDIPIDWEKLFGLTLRLSKTDARIAEVVGVCLAYLQKRSMGIECQGWKEEERVAKRFYVALILRDFISEVPMKHICRKFNLSHGAIEALQERSLMYASMSATFCGCLGWIHLKLVISEFQKRIHGGARPEIVHLTEIAYVNSQRARRLHKAGFGSIESIADVNSIERLATALMFGNQSDDKPNNLYLARKIACGAQRLLREKLASIEETKAVLDVVADDETIVSQDEYPSPEEKSPVNEEPAEEEDAVEEGQALAEQDLTLSLGRLSFDPVPFIRPQGIVLLETEPEIRALCRYLSVSDTKHVSIVSHFEGDATCLAGVAVSWSETAVAYASISDHQHLNHFKNVLEDRDMQKSTFKLSDSMPWMTSLICEDAFAAYGSIIDVREAARLLIHFDLALNDIAGLYLVFGLEEEYQEVKKSFSDVSRVSYIEFQILNTCSAAALTRRLWIILEGRLQGTQLSEYCAQIHMPYLNMMQHSVHKGILTSKNKLSNHLQSIEDQIKTATEACQHFSEMPIDPSSDAEVEAILLALNVKGSPQGRQLDEKTLRELQDSHPFAAVILHFRSLADIQAVLSLAIENSHGDRVSLQGHMLQQIFRAWMEDEEISIQSLPIHEVVLNDGVISMLPIGWGVMKDPTNIRECLMSDEGVELFVAEYMHLDLWLLAHFSQDSQLIAALARSNGDPFKAMVAVIMHPSDDQTADDMDFCVSYFQRFLVGYLFGSGPSLHAQILGVNEQQARQSHDNFCDIFQGRPSHPMMSLSDQCLTGIAEWMKQMTPTSSLPMEVWTIHGRRIVLQQPCTVQSALRSIIQGSISDILKHASILIAQKLNQIYPSSRLLFRRNQEMVFEVRGSLNEDTLSIIREALMEVAKMNIPTDAMYPMVKAYLRYNHESAFGVIVSNCNAVFNASGDSFLTAALESIIVWNSRTGERVSTLTDSAVDSRPIEVKTLSTAPTENTVAAGYSDGSVRIWDLASMTLTASFAAHKRPVIQLAFAPFGDILASGSQDTNICLWDITGEAGMYKLRGHSHEITGISFVKDQDFLVSSSKDGQLKLWDLSSQHCCQTLLHDKGIIWSLTINPVEGHIIVGSVDTDLIVYSLDRDASASLTLLTTIKRSEDGRVRALRVSRDGKHLTCINSKKTIEIFTFRSEDEAKEIFEKRQKEARKVIKELDRKKEKEGELDKRLSKKRTRNEKRLHQSLEDLQFYQSLLLYQGTAKLISADIHPSQMLELGIAMSNNAFEMVTIRSGDDEAKQPFPQSRLEVHQSGHRSGIRALVISSDDEYLLSTSEKESKIWHCSSGSCVHTLASGYGLSGLFAPGDSLVVVGTKSGTLELFDLLSANMIESVSAHDGPIWSIVSLIDRSGCITGSADNWLKTWKWGIKEEDENQRSVSIIDAERSLKMDTDILSLRMSPKGQHLAVALLDATIRILHLDTFNVHLTLYGHKLPILSIDISSDNQLLISGSADKNIRIWGMDFGDCHKSVFAHNDSVTQVAFVHTTHYAMSVSKDGMLKYWDADKFELLLELPGHHAEVWCLAISHEGDSIFTGSNDRSLRKWTRSDEPFFLEDEKEKRLETMFDAHVEDDHDEDDQDMAGRRNAASMSAADALAEALELSAFEAMKAPTEQPNPLLLGLEPSTFVQRAVQRIKSSELEMALLSLSFTDTLQLLTHLADWLRQHCTETETTCRIIVVLVRLHHRQLLTSPKSRSILEDIQMSIKDATESLKDAVGFNLEGIRYIKHLTMIDKTSL